MVVVWGFVVWLLFVSSCAAGLCRLSNSSFSSFLLRNMNSFFGISFLKRKVLSLMHLTYSVCHYQKSVRGEEVMSTLTTDAF